MPGPAPFEIEVLDADPRRVKRVRIYNVNARRLERNRRETKRGGLPSVVNAPSTSADHPAAAGQAVPQKGARRP